MISIYILHCKNDTNKTEENSFNSLVKGKKDVKLYFYNDQNKSDAINLLKNGNLDDNTKYIFIHVSQFSNESILNINPELFKNTKFYLFTTDQIGGKESLNNILRSLKKDGLKIYLEYRLIAQVKNMVSNLKNGG